METTNLPNGWESAIDPSTGRTYYINHLTQQTSWTPPVFDPLPSGWEEKKDEQGRTFFYNSITGISQWDDPRIMGTNSNSLSSISNNFSSDISSNLETNVSYPKLSNVDKGINRNNNNRSDAIEIPSSSLNLSSWQCSKCTYQNSSNEENCIMCGTGASLTSSSYNNNNISSSRNTDEEYAASLQQQFENEIDDSNIVSAGSIASGSEVSETVTDPIKLIPFMVPDASSKNCLKCHKDFTMLSRRHHCKNCGMLACDKCSSFKTKVPIANVGDKESRVCGWCYEQLTSGYKHCLLRYLLIVGEGSKERSNDRKVALQGIADCIEAIPRMVSVSATQVESAAVSRDLEVIDMVGGVARLCSFLEHDDSPETQYEACRVLVAIANAAIAEPFGSQTLSKKNVASEYCQGTAPEVTKIILNRSSSISRSAQCYLVQFIYLLSDLSEIKQIVKVVELIPAMCEFLLSTDEKLQDWSLLTLSKLMAGDGENIEAMLKANGVHALAILLSSQNPIIQEHAAIALGEALSTHGYNNSPSDKSRANRVKDALVGLNGTNGAVSLMRSNIPMVARAGQKLMQLLSDSEAESLRSAGGVPLVVAQLATRDPLSQAQALQTLANMASVGAADRQAILESGGLAMAVPLLNDVSMESYRVRRFAAALCDKFSNDPNAAQVIVQAGGVGFMVNIIRLQGSGETYSDENIMTAIHCANSIGQMISHGLEYQTIIINSGAIEALLSMRGMDASIVDKTVSSIYIFVSDENLLVLLSKRIAPQMLAMKLVNLLNTSSGLIVPHVMEMLLLIVAILCGARQNDHIKNQNLSNDSTNFASPIEKMLSGTSIQTSELVLANGINFLLPLLNSSNPPGVILATLRTLLAISTNAIQKAEKLIAAGGIGNIVNSIERSISKADESGEQVHQQIVLYGMTLFSTICGRNGVRIALSPSQQSQVKNGIQIIASCLECNDIDLVVSSVRTLRECSFQSSNWDAVAEKALPRLMEMLLADKNQQGPHGNSLPSHIILQLLVDVAIITSNLAKLEKYCTMVRESGGIFALVGLLSEHDDDPVTLGVSTLIALSESSLSCREAIVQLNAVSILLQLAEQRNSPLNILCLQCVELLTKDSKHAALLSKKEPTAIDTLLRLNRFVGSSQSNNAEQGSVSQYALAILLNIAHDEESALWDQLIINGDIHSCVNLLKIGPPKVQGNASLTLANICNGNDNNNNSGKDDTKKNQTIILHSSQLNSVIEVIPIIVNLLIPSDKLGSDKSESPAKEAANACYLLSKIPSIRESLIQSNIIQSLSILILRERRMGRFRSSTIQSCICALRSLCNDTTIKSIDNESVESSIEKNFWIFLSKSNNLSDGISAITMVIDSHIRDTSPTFIKVDPSIIAEAACHFLFSIPQNRTDIILSTADINLLGRAARPLTLAFDRKADSENDIRVRQSALHAMTRLVKEDGLAAQLINAGCVRAACQSLIYVEESWKRDAPMFVEASLLLSELIESTNDKIVFDAVVSSEAISNLVALLVFASSSSTNEDDKNDLFLVVDSALRALSSLVCGGGRSVAKTLVESKDFISTLCSLLINSDDQLPGKHCVKCLTILAKISSLDEYRELLCTPSFNIVDSVSLLLLTSNKEVDENENNKLKDINTNQQQSMEEYCIELFINISAHLQELSDKIVEPLIQQLNKSKLEIKMLSFRALNLLSMHGFDMVKIISNKQVFDSISQICTSLQPSSKNNLQETVLESLQLLISINHHKVARDVCASNDDIFISIAQLFINSQNESIIVNAITSLLVISSEPKARVIIRNVNRGSLLKEIRRIYTSNSQTSYIGHQTLQLLKILGDDLTNLQPQPLQPANKIIKTMSSDQVHSKTLNIQQQILPIQQPSIAPSFNMINSSPINSTGFFPLVQQPTISPTLSTSPFPLQQQQQQQKQAILPPPPFPPPPLTQAPKPTMLPVFTTPQPIPTPKPSRMSTSSMSENSLSDEELARRLQEEENAASKKPIIPSDKISPPITNSNSSDWSCPACTYRNSNSNNVCDVCQTPKSGVSSTMRSTNPSPSSALPKTSPLTIDVKCSSCKATLRVPSSAKAVRCPKCKATTGIN